MLKSFLINHIELNPKSEEPQYQIRNFEEAIPLLGENIDDKDKKIELKDKKDNLADKKIFPDGGTIERMKKVNLTDFLGKTKLILLGYIYKRTR